MFFPTCLDSIARPQPFKIYYDQKFASTCKINVSSISINETSIMQKFNSPGSFPSNPLFVNFTSYIVNILVPAILCKGHLI